MTRDEIVTALRCYVSVAPDCCKSCPAAREDGCEDAIKVYAADLIENQQRHIAALMQANDSLKDTIARRDKQIEDMKQGMAQPAKAVAVKEEEEIAKLQGDLIRRNAELLEARQNLSETRYRVEYMDRDLKEACQKITNMKSRCVDMKNELCQYCGKYKQAHEGACDGCRWRDM